ncbi:MAG: cysteine methyltransferase [Chloroflexaceae bacterium]|nr:cysteine methyltransferase [Chloroflexaceae bacterium]NJO05998.1 cysteine methyltransferase [Chloroflexaceae bacterium]
MNSYQHIYDTVRRIPPGKISSYGRIAALAGLAGQARLVGYALHALRTGGVDEQGQPVPWWRVINVAGRISNEYEATLQRELLEAEGIAIDARNAIDLERYLWDGAVAG